VYLFLQQRHPKFRLAGNENFYVDDEKNIIPVSYNDAARLPVVSGLVTKSMAKGELFDFVSYLEENPFWNAQIEQIYIRPDRKIELVPRVGTGIILLGNLKDYEKKLHKLKILYEKGFNEFGWNYYKTIDLQYENQIVCTKTDNID
jgi:cell division protein FtsQ